MYNYSYTFIYVILTALSMVFINHAANYISPALNLFLGVALAIIFFHAINFRYIKMMYQKAWHAKLLWLQILLTVAGMWISTIYGPAFLTPNVFILIVFSLITLLGIAATCITGIRASLVVSAIGVLVCSTLIVIDFLHRTSFTDNTLLGIVLGLVGGASFYLYSKVSFSFAKVTSLTATQVLAVRFWLVELICLFLLSPSLFHNLTIYGLSLVVIIAMISLIIPIYFLMKGILAVGPDRNAILCGLIPAVTYIAESIYFLHFDVIILFLNICTGLFIGLPYFIKLSK